jgi:predicted ATPase
LRLCETPHTWAEFSSSQLLQNTPLHPIAEWGRQRFGAETPGERRLADLENALRLIGLDSAEYAPLLAPLVDISLPEERAAKLAPEELRSRQLAAIVAWVLASARSQPLVLAIEDLHWSDPSSLNLMQALAERGRTAPLFIIATARPEFRPPWSPRSHHSVISLSPLDRADVAQMVGKLSARHALNEEVVERVSERTGGVPLFVEEVTLLQLERGEEDGAHMIPPTLQQSLAARRLGEAREVAQIGAVLGRDFSFPLLRAVSGVDDPALQSALDRLANTDLLVAEGSGPEASYRFKHALIQDAAYDSLLKSRRQAPHRRAAEVLCDQPERAAAEPEVIAHHFTEAGLDDHAIEWWGKAGDQALRRSAFQEAIAHLSRAIAMADKGGGFSRQGQRLHVAYGNALIATHGYGAPETIEAFAKARESATDDKGASERLAADYGLWVGSYVRGELSAMRAYAEAFLGDVQAKPDSPEAGVAHRAAGLTHWFAGEYREARGHLERAVALFEPGRDDDLAFRFGQDAGVIAVHYLALTLWPLGDIERAVSLVGDAEARIVGHPHIGTRANGKWHLAMFELMLGDLSRAASVAAELTPLTRERELPLWRAVAMFLEGLAGGRGGAARGGLESMRRGIELLREQNVLVSDGLVKIVLAKVEARQGDVDRALAILDEALAMCERTGHRAFEAELHRVRGEMLLKLDPANLATAEEAFRTAIAIARRQATRSFELRSALSLAKLCQSTDRLTDAHAVLAPALEGFAPTPEMPEIAEAQTLLAALAETDEVKAYETQRQQRLRLHVSYGNALIAARGPGAPETIEAFARAREQVGGDNDSSERLAADYGLYVSAFVRGELSSMRAHAAAILADVETRPDSAEAGVAHRVQGMTHWFAGEFLEAQQHLERAVAAFQPGRDDDLSFRFVQDAGATAMIYLAFASWPLGEIERAVSLIERMRAQIGRLTHADTVAFAVTHAAMFALMSDDHLRVQTNMAELARVVGEHDLAVFRAFGVFFDGWATVEDGSLADGLERMRRGVEDLREQNVLPLDGLVKIAFAAAEAGAGEIDHAIALLDEALATSERIGHRTFEAELHRVRGEMLLKRDPANLATAEEAFRTAIDVARRQATRSFELRAALPLARLYQSTGRPVEAYDVLAPALEGFSPTAKMLEIAEAKALLERLAHAGGGRGLSEAVTKSKIRVCRVGSASMTRTVA